MHLSSMLPCWHEHALCKKASVCWIWFRVAGRSMPVCCSFYIREDGTPVRLHERGNDLFSGSHFGDDLTLDNCHVALRVLLIPEIFHNLDALKLCWQDAPECCRRADIDFQRARADADDWQIDFTSYNPGIITQPVFDLPKLCEGVQPGNRSVTTSGFARRMQRLLPGANIPTAGPQRRLSVALATIDIHSECCRPRGELLLTQKT